MKKVDPNYLSKVCMLFENIIRPDKIPCIWFVHDKHLFIFCSNVSASSITSERLNEQNNTFLYGAGEYCMLTIISNINYQFFVVV